MKAKAPKDRAIARLLDVYFPSLSSRQRRLYLELEASYAHWNARLNLVSRKDLVHFPERHLLHSLAFARCCSLLDGAQVIDLGTGGGLPALPLAIFFPKAQFTLVDAIRKKIDVVSEIAEELSLSNVRALHARIEALEGCYDLAIGRAVAPLPRLLGWLHRVEKRQHMPLAHLLYYWTARGLRPSMPHTSHLLEDLYHEQWFSTKQIIQISLR